MKHVVAYLKDTREAYTRLLEQDSRYMDEAIVVKYGLSDMKERQAYRREFVDQLDDAIEILETT